MIVMMILINDHDVGLVLTLNIWKEGRKYLGKTYDDDGEKEGGMMMMMVKIMIVMMILMGGHDAVVV